MDLWKDSRCLSLTLQVKNMGVHAVLQEVLICARSVVCAVPLSLVQLGSQFPHLQKHIHPPAPFSWTASTSTVAVFDLRSSCPGLSKAPWDNLDCYWCYINKYNWNKPVWSQGATLLLTHTILDYFVVYCCSICQFIVTHCHHNKKYWAHNVFIEILTTHRNQIENTLEINFQVHIKKWYKQVKPAWY